MEQQATWATRAGDKEMEPYDECQTTVLDDVNNDDDVDDDNDEYSDAVDEMPLKL